MAGVPFIFGNATTSIPLSNLDANFNTGLTIGNTTVGLGNTVTTLGNVTLNNVTINSGTSNVSPANVVATTLTIGGVALGAGDASIMKNRIINGAMVIDQRNAGASGTVINTYTLDRWYYQASAASKLTWQQNAGSVTPPVGFTNYIGFTSSSAFSIGSGDYFFLYQPIEGYNIADLGWGTANGKTVTLSFQVQSSLTGNFGGSIRNSAGNQNYPFSYTISAANTWTSVSVTIPAPNTGSSWNSTNGLGLQLVLSMAAGSAFSGTANAWTASNIYSVTGSTSVVGTSGATFYITGVQLEVGSSATGFEYRQYGQELALCQRYYYQTPNSTIYFSRGTSGLAYSTTGFEGAAFLFPQPMRASPSYSASGTVNFYNPSLGRVTNTGTVGIYLATTDTVYLNNANNGSGFVINSVYWLAGTVSNPSISFSAEL